MKYETVKTLNITYNASGAVQAALRDDVVMIVDIIDMSTSAEAVLEAGAVAVFGASPDDITVPVVVNPTQIGYKVGEIAVKNNSEVIIVTEPRFGDLEAQLARVKLVKQGIEKMGGQVKEILPNVGQEIIELSDFAGQVVVIVSNSGGVAFDAAYNHGARKVITGTVVRTRDKSGTEIIETVAKRAITWANEYQAGITLVAASANCYEDILAVERIAKEIIELGFLKL